MTKSILLDQFEQAHIDLMSYVQTLSDAAYLYSYADKWTAGQQIAHIILCLQVTGKALLPAEVIEQRFGKIDRPEMTFDELVGYYQAGLRSGGKAPERFLPSAIAIEQRIQLNTELTDLLASIRQQLMTYSEEEMSSLSLPHPFLGKLSIRELFYLMTYHAGHHQRQIAAHLQLSPAVLPDTSSN